MAPLSPEPEPYASIPLHLHLPLPLPPTLRGRNTAFQNAIARAAARRAPQTVLEIGTGSGLLAMVAARLPQISHVFTIEANPDLAKLARKIVDLNRLSAKITVVPAVSTQVTVHTVPQPCGECEALVVLCQ